MGGCSQNGFPFVGIPVPTPAALQPFPYAFKWTFTYLDFAAAALTNQVLIVSIPARTRIWGACVYPKEGFGGGAISSYQIGIGIVGDPDRYCAYYEAVLFGPAYGFGFDGGGSVASIADPTDIMISALAVGANLNAAIVGTVEVILELSQWPALF